MSKSRLYVFIAFVLLILILAGVFLWVLTSPADNEPTEPDATPSVTQPTGGDATPEPSAAPTATAAPEATATPSPTPTPVPTDDGKAHTRSLEKSGSFASESDTALKLEVAWSVTSKNDDELLVTVTVSARHYSLVIGQRYGTISVGDQSRSFTSSSFDIENGGNYTTTTQLASESFVVPCKLGESVDLPVSATWSYNGAYSGVDYKDIVASGSIHIDG